MSRLCQWACTKSSSIPYQAIHQCRCAKYLQVCTMLSFNSRQKFQFQNSEHRFQFSKKSGEYLLAIVKLRWKIWNHWLMSKQLKFRCLKIESIGLLMTTTKTRIERNSFYNDCLSFEWVKSCTVWIIHMMTKHCIRLFAFNTAS